MPPYRPLCVLREVFRKPLQIREIGPWSESGHGSCYLSGVNRHTPCSSPVTPMTSMPQDGPGRPRVLIVDDEPFFAEFLRRRLAPDEYEVVIAHGGEEALERSEAFRPDVALLDIMMPGMSGLDTCIAMRGAPETADAQIVLVTALEGEDHMVRGLAAGADDFLSKGVSGAELRARVRAHVRSKERLDAIRHLEARRDLLVHMLAHDIRSPLTSVVVNAYLLEGAQPEEAEVMREEIRAGGQRMKAMIDNLLLTAKSESGELEVRREFVDPQELVAEVVRLFRPVAEDQLVTLRVRTGSVDQVEMDAGLVIRALENLLSNAVNASPSGGVVTIGVDVVAGALVLTVSDQGDGVPEARREAIFQRFRGGERPTSIGLGLALVRHVADAHGGTVEVDDAAGGGARFEFRIPAAHSEELADEAGDDDLVCASSVA